MFICDACNQLSAEGEKPRRIVVARREGVRYPETGRINGSEKRKDDSLREPGRPGWEIAREATVHARCAPDA